MGMRFRKSINLGGGAKININKSSIGMSGGINGARVSANSHGQTTKSVGVPGTGVSFRSTSGGSSKSSNDGCTVSAIKILLFFCVAALIILYAWIPAIIAGIIYIIYCYKTQSPVNKMYVIIGALIFAVSLSAFIYNTVNSSKNPSHSSAMVTSSQVAHAPSD